MIAVDSVSEVESSANLASVANFVYMSLELALSVRAVSTVVMSALRASPDVRAVLLALAASKSLTAAN